MKLKDVVSVLVISDVTTMSVDEMISFTNDEAGRYEANELFTQFILSKAPETTGSQLEDFQDDGYYWFGNYYVALINSIYKLHESEAAALKSKGIVKKLQGKKLPSTPTDKA